MFRRLKSFSAASAILAAGLLVSACEEDRDQASTATDTGTQTQSGIPAPAQTPAEHRLGRIDLTQPLRLLGTEPFWHLDTTPATLSFSPMDGAKQAADNPGAVVEGTSARWSAQTQSGTPIVARVTLKDCSDGMSDRIYPLSATLKIGNQDFTGCAASLKALEAAGEAGRVE